MIRHYVNVIHAGTQNVFRNHHNSDVVGPLKFCRLVIKKFNEVEYIVQYTILDFFF